MLKIGKKILCTLLVVVLCLTSAPLQGFVGLEWPELSKLSFGELFVNKAIAKEVASSGSCGNNVTYTYNSSTGELIISGTGAMKDYSGTSPFQGTSIKSVVIERGVTSVGDYAFYNCSNLASVTLPEGITIIGFHAFSECSSLSYIKLPDSLITIEAYAFSGCTNLNNIAIPNGVQVIKRGAFELCSSFTKFVFPNGIATIDGGLFVYCYGLTSVTIPKSITSINEYAFRHCNSLVDIYYLGSEDDWNTINIIEDNKVIDNATIHFAEASHVHAAETVVVRSSCTETGMQYDICAFCGEILSDVTYLPAGHTPGNWEIVTKPSYESEGKKQKKCTVCNEVLETESIPKNNELDYLHPFGDYSNDYGTVHWEFDKITGKLIISGTGMLYGGSFESCNAIKSVVIEKGFTSIHTYVFSDCTNLERLEIPNTVISIEDSAFSNCKALTQIALPDGILSIGLNAFRGCTSLRNVIIPESVTDIEDGAFYGCTSLREVTVPNGVITIAHSAFESCENLRSIIIPQSVTTIGSSAFNGCVSLNNVLLPASLTDIGHRAFYNCTSLTDIIIPNSVISIGEEAFSGCINLSKLELSENLTRIESSVFYNCSVLTEIVIPNCVTYIGYDAFSGCSKIKKITMPASTVICNGAFKDCLFVEYIYITKGNGELYGRHYQYDVHNSFSYTPWYISKSEKLTVVLEAGITSIGQYAFKKSEALKYIVIPESVTYIGVGAFEKCINLNKINIPASASICPNAFDECLAIGEITISKGSGKMNEFTDYYSYEYTPWYVARNNDLSIVVSDGITNIVANAFKDCVGLKKITFPKDLITIGTCSFAGCSNITSIIIPDSVTTIGICAFSSCTKMNSITIPAGIEMLSGSFSSCKPSEVVITKGKENLYTNSDSDANAIPWKNAKKVVIEYGVTAIGNEVFANCKNIENISIPNSVTYIGDGAFNGCEMLEQIDLPDKIVEICPDTFKNCYSLIKIDLPQDLTCIGSNAFYGCKNLLELIVPETAESIGNNAFYNCSSLFNISIPDSINSIGECAFYGCSSISSIKIPRDLRIVNNGTFDSCKNLSNLDLGDNIEKIGNRAFAVCTNLTDVVIPDSVTEIGDYAFSGCTNMVSIKISDSATNIGNYSFYNCSKLTDISIPASAYYSKNTFENCTAITNVIISKGTGTMVEFSSGESSIAPWYTSKSDSISVTIKHGVKNIRNLAFSGCTGLKNITIPYSVNDIGEFSFANCTGLTDIIIPYNVKNIGSFAFFGCSNLKELRISKEISTIGIHAFGNCKSLKDIYYHGSEDEWNIITKGEDVVDPSYTTIHYNSDNTGSSGDGTPTYSENFKFSFESYSINMGQLLTDKGVVTLVYKSDKETISNFNVASIDFEVSDNSIFRFKEAYREPSNLDTMVKISCWVEGLKLGSATLTATLPDGTTANCEIEVTEEEIDDGEDEEEVDNDLINTEAENDAFVQQHLLFRKAYYDYFTNDLRWASAIWNHMDTWKTEAAELAYDIIEGALEIVSLQFLDGLEVAANPYDVILLDFLASNISQSHFAKNAKEDALTVAVDIVNKAIKIFSDDSKWDPDFDIKNEVKLLITSSDYSQNNLYLALDNLHDGDYSDKITKIFNGFDCFGQVMKAVTAGAKFADMFVELLRYTVAIEGFYNSTAVFKSVLDEIATEMEVNNPVFASYFENALEFYEDSLTYDSIVEYVIKNKGVGDTAKLIYDMSTNVISDATVSFIMKAFKVGKDVARKVNAALWSAEVGWGLSNLLTGNNVSIGCRRMLRATYALDVATYNVMERFGTILDRDESYGAALCFDSSFNIFKMTQLYSLEQYKKYCENMATRPFTFNKSEFKNADEFLTAATVTWKNINCHYIEGTSSFNAALVDTLMVACPTDIYVYRKSDNKLVASVINNKSTLYDDSVAILCVGDEKCFAAMDIDDYKIEITATDDGVMDVVYNKYVDFKNTDSFRFDNFKITQSSTYEVQNDQKSIKNEDNIVYSHDGKISGCSCKCHKSGIAKFFFKIGLFFQKIFKKNKVCKCGVYHY